MNSTSSHRAWSKPLAVLDCGGRAERRHRFGRSNPWERIECLACHPGKSGVALIPLLFAILLPLLVSAHELEVHRHTPSGRAMFARFDEASPRAKAANAAPTDALATADALLQSVAGELALPDPLQDLAPRRPETDRLGMTRVVYEQRYRGIPVYAAGVIVHLGADGQPRSVCADVLPDLQVDLSGRLTAEDASAAARASCRDQAHHTNVTILSTRKCVFAPGIIQHDNSTEGWLVWEVRVSAGDAVPDAQRYFIDARTGELRFQTTDTYGIDRKIYDCSAQPGTGVCWSNLTTEEFGYPYKWGRIEGSATNGPNPRYLPEIYLDDDIAYDLMGALLTFYQTVLGRNGANNLGGTCGNTDSNHPYTRSMTQNYIDYANGGNGCPNAAFYWPDGVLLFCAGEVVPDITAHEYAHAVSHFEVPGGLTYYGESGALNENYSDLSGEMFEKWYTGTNDWIAGTGNRGGPYRVLSDPPSRPSINGAAQSDRFHSLTHYCGDADNSGVHRNSTVITKAAYLLSEGGFFNGCTIPQIGTDKVYQIWYRALTQYYVSSETFNGAAAKLVQASRDLYPTEPQTITAVQRALQSVEMDQAGHCSGQPATVPLALDAVGW